MCPPALMCLLVPVIHERICTMRHFIAVNGKIRTLTKEEKEKLDMHSPETKADLLRSKMLEKLREKYLGSSHRFSECMNKRYFLYLRR